MTTLNALIVDDSPTAALFLQAKLESAAHELASLKVTRAKSGEEALALTQQQHFDLAILDVVLPGIDGFSVCKSIKSQPKPTVVALLTALQTEADKQKGAAAGCDTYIVKPIDEQTLGNVIKLAYLKAQNKH